MTRDPWKRAPVGELQEQLLPRWFVLVGLAMVPLALAVLVWGFLANRPEDVPLGARRPPPAEGYTNAVGDVILGDTEATPAAGTCEQLDGVRIAGEEVDRSALGNALAQLCRLDEGTALGRRLARFADDGGTIRFAVFERTGVDSTARRQGADGAPLVLVNVKYARSPGSWIAPLIAHDVTLLDQVPGTVAGALEARRAEDRVCRTLFRVGPPPRACEDAAALLGLPDPAAELRAAGYE